MIKRNDFSDHVEIGINIYKAKCNNETFVLKELKESETIQETLKIIKILQNIPHPNVVKFHGLINAPMEIMTLTQSGVRETASEMLLEYDSLYMSCWDEDPEK
ncbi:43523_t:CDS:2 [Gigaspora margarita]|uniref:43523_t:CDS:1 n=1 Tax=Gigaspora margarita TaxID=4874 RepID=A0ABN7V0V2_GIGMA|nr:43523_t:CDS:2 [Gigaspora margarita]